MKLQRLIGGLILLAACSLWLALFLKGPRIWCWAAFLPAALWLCWRWMIDRAGRMCAGDPNPRQGGFCDSVAFVLQVLWIATAGLASPEPALLLLSMGAALAAWDLGGLDRRLRTCPEPAERRRVIESRLRRLWLAPGLALPPAWLALRLPLKPDLPVALLLAIMLPLFLRQLLLGFSSREQSAGRKRQQLLRIDGGPRVKDREVSRK